MRYRVTFLNDNGYAINHETVEAVSGSVAGVICGGNHPMGRYGRISVEPESAFPAPSPLPTFDRSTGRYHWPERKEA